MERQQGLHETHVHSDMLGIQHFTSRTMHTLIAYLICILEDSSLGIILFTQLLHDDLQHTTELALHLCLLLDSLLACHRHLKSLMDLWQHNLQVKVAEYQFMAFHTLDGYSPCKLTYVVSWYNLLSLVNVLTVMSCATTSRVSLEADLTRSLIASNAEICTLAFS